ncbi:MAG: glycosyltransferase [Rubrivivax sp.]
MKPDHCQSMRLTVITVVFNDWPGLEKTIDSMVMLRAIEVEHWVVDGSTTDEVKRFLADSSGIRWISEPDQGIYDAMNKGLDRATGDYVLFMNAGDVFHPQFDVQNFFELTHATSQVLLGSVVETTLGDDYLNPGNGYEANVFDAPRHQATFYPKQFVANHRYDLKIKIGSDGELTHRAIERQGATFVSMPVAIFEKGGVSSTYGSWRVLRQRFAESTSVKSTLKLATKALLWHIMPRRLFYSLLASYKHSRLLPGQILAVGKVVLHRPARSCES